MSADGVNGTLEARGETYGSFADNAAIAQTIKAAIRCGESWGKLHPDQREALEMIASKMSRIVSGDPNHHDSWLDISGYATLIERRLK